jgi:hypothetical protein
LIRGLPPTEQVTSALFQAEHDHPTPSAYGLKSSVRRKAMSVITQLFSATAVVSSAAAKARIGNWPDPMGRAGSAASR